VWDRATDTYPAEILDAAVRLDAIDVTVAAVWFGACLNTPSEASEALGAALAPGRALQEGSVVWFSAFILSILPQLGWTLHAIWFCMSCSAAAVAVAVAAAVTYLCP
jgi:hypothetical protein